MATLSPKLASEMAQSAYSLLDSSSKFRDRNKFGNPYIRNNFEFQDSGIGKTGGFILNSQSGFAAMGVGKGGIKEMQSLLFVVLKQASIGLQMYK